jgi:KDO2-lipid IV(A) lauroyltransferase
MSWTYWLREARFLLEYLPIRLFFALVGSLSHRQVHILMRGLSRCAYRLLAFDREWCLRNLRLAFGDRLTPGQRKKLAMQAFENFAATIAEMLCWTPEWMAAHVTMEANARCHEVARTAYERSTGIILITGHLGNFELIGAWGKSFFPNWRTTVVYRPADNWRVEQLIESMRGRYLGMEKVTRGYRGTLALLDTLREGHTVGLLIDQNTTRGGVFVDFLGFQASTAPGAAALALETGCPVFLVTDVREPEGRHRVIFHPPFDLIRTGNWRQDLVANTQQYTKAFEGYVLAHPEQYFWMHPRWRFRPDKSWWSLEMPYEQMAAERNGPPRQPWSDQPQQSDTAATRPAA